MILMVSGRTDIIKFYTPWFIKRLEEGFIDVRNPINLKLVSRIFLKDVNLIVFCTKDPRPIVPFLKNIKIPFLFQVTLTAYQNDIEINVRDKSSIIASIKEISKIIGKENLFLRYDPILLNDKYDVNYHIKAFRRINELLNGYVYRYIISFIDIYKNVIFHKNELKLKEISKANMKEICEVFSMIAKDYNSEVSACAESDELLNYGLIKGNCISLKDAYRLTGSLDFKKQNIRKSVNCSCLKTVDIGVYNSCLNKCLYCYANFKEEDINNNYLKHDINSSMLIGHLNNDDIIKIRKD